MQYVKYYYHVVISFCISLVVIIFCHLLSNTSPVSRAVTVNITEITQPWIVEIAQMNLTEEENVLQFSTRIEVMYEILREISHEYHWLIISSPTVLAGAQDITPFVLSEIQEKLNQGE